MDGVQFDEWQKPAAGSAPWTPEQATQIAGQALAARGMSPESLTLLRFGTNGLFKVQGNPTFVMRVSSGARSTINGFRCAQILSSEGFDVLGPIMADALDVVDGHEVSYWPYLEEDHEGIVDFEKLGSLIRAVHDQAASLQTDLNISSLDPAELRVDQLEKIGRRLVRLRASGTFGSAELGALDSHYERVTEAWDSICWEYGVVLHGDVHPGNVLVSGSRQLLLDFDHVGPGPRAWDHMPMLSQVRFFGSDKESYNHFSRGYGADVLTDPGVEVLLEARALASTTWVAQLSLARPELGAEASKRIKYWQSEVLAEAWSAK
jgi:hypothetical protein